MSSSPEFRQKPLLIFVLAVASPVFHCLPPATKLGQGYVFTGICDSVNRGGLPQCMLGYHPHPRRRPLRTRHPPGPAPPDQAPHPQEETPGTRHPPTPHRACWEIRSTRGWYASYWNAILFVDICK